MENEMIKSECEDTLSKYFYFINCSEMEKELCNMEIRSIFGKEPEAKYLFSEKNFDPSRSPFIKLQIKSIYIEKNLENIINKIKHTKISYDDFKVNYIKSENGDVSYEERLKAVKRIGFVVTGFPNIHNPKIELAITKVKNKWIFGELIRNNFKWQRHNEKPHSYSNAVPLRMARALVNIAVGDNRELSLVDPCCGVGTVVIEALDLGINVKGYEISKPIACNARNNIEFLGYNREIITSGDMHDINECFDVAIVDIPYGLFSPVTLQEQVDIINTSRRIARKIVIITFEDMDNLIISAGFKIVEKCYIRKGNMIRQISICV
ncbi:TRM11 family methyltransferase [Clostridium sp.]|uniref:TRM11 family SAM-dependent methyltransferase n=1 Tax=Clostridium sp. TaxID=1506 RepID=UPI0025F725BA|nr:SAM-dependent methyltransferase [uncultured Clostridium sp.]MDU4884902.1 SAM-dependent methyltransferase [Clostridium celatum]MDU7078106.1 SAM-dependent methyltransferase [Clostridium celatum]